MSSKFRFRTYKCGFKRAVPDPIKRDTINTGIIRVNALRQHGYLLARFAVLCSYEDTFNENLPDPTTSSFWFDVFQAVAQQKPKDYLRPAWTEYLKFIRKADKLATNTDTQHPIEDQLKFFRRQKGAAIADFYNYQCLETQAAMHVVPRTRRTQ